MRRSRLGRRHRRCKLSCGHDAPPVSPCRNPARSTRGRRAGRRLAECCGVGGATHPLGHPARARGAPCRGRLDCRSFTARQPDARVRPAQRCGTYRSAGLDTPLPPEEPAGQNPPDGAPLDYVLPKQVNTLKLEILDQGGKLVRSYSNDDALEKLDSAQLQHPLYWIRPSMTLATSLGHHRFIWDLRFEEPKGASKGLAIAAVYQNTARGPSGPFVSPGNYVVRLTVDGRISERSIQVRIDPRVSISDSDLKRQTDLSMQCYNSYKTLQIIRDEIDSRLSDSKRKLKEESKKQMLSLRGTGKPDAGDILYSSIYEVPLEQETIVGLQGKFLFLLGILQSSDSKPTTQAQDGVNKLTLRLSEISEKWVKIK